MAMQLDERDEGEYRIYAGAMESKLGDGYIAALVVSKVRGVPRPREAYRDDALACGHRWESAKAALSYAFGKGREVIHSEAHRLNC
jgi:hypothetical protein